MDKKESTLPEERTLLETIFKYISIILIYKLPIVIITGLAMIGVVLFSVISLKLPPEKSPLPNIYKSHAIIMFQDSQSGSAGFESLLSTFGLDASSAGGASDPLQIAMQLLASKPFIDSVVDEFNIIENYNITNNIKTKSRRIISQSAEHAFDMTSRTLSIAHTSTDPQFAADIVNYKIKLLESWFQNEGVSVRTKELSTLNEKLGELTNSISKIEEEIKSFQIKHGSLDINQLAESQSAILLDLRKTLNNIELEISQYTEYSTIDDPALIQLKTQRDHLINQIKQVEKGYISSDGRKIPSTDELPGLALEFAHMEAGLELQMQLYRTLSERSEKLKLAATENNVFNVIEYAEVAEEKQGPLRGKICIIVTIVAFLASIALCLTFHYLKKIFSDPNTIAIIKGSVK